MDFKDKLDLYQNLITCGNDIYTWCFDKNGKLLYSNCPDEALFYAAFSNFGCKEAMLENAKESGSPVILGTAMGLIWGVAFEFSGDEFNRAYAIGPAFFYDIPMKTIEEGFASYQNIETSLAWKIKLLDIVRKVPVAQNIIFSHYLLMLHYCITGEKIHISEIDLKAKSTIELSEASKKRDRHQIWTKERAMLQMVRTGDLNYAKVLDNAISSSDGVPVIGKDALRQAKTSITVFISIVCRAAIEGGLSPEEAYSLGDAYIQAAEQANDYSELRPVSTIMYNDFVQRVHRCRTNPKTSSPIKRCCDYIEMNLDKKIKADDLAKLVGYSEYYLTSKFKEETGVSVNDYIKYAKIERAKILLERPEITAQEISEQLGFASRNYFSRVFSEVTGKTPTEYRQAL